MTPAGLFGLRRHSLANLRTTVEQIVPAVRSAAHVRFVLAAQAVTGGFRRRILSASGPPNLFRRPFGLSLLQNRRTRIQPVACRK